MKDFESKMLRVAAIAGIVAIIADTLSEGIKKFIQPDDKDMIDE